MCLSLLTKTLAGKPFTMEKDFIVYKVLRISSGRVLSTFFRLSVIDIGQTYHSRFTYDEHGYIHRGLHTFVDKEEAENMAKRYRAVLVKCMIPKGSRYYDGLFNVGWKRLHAYASNCLIYLEVIQDFKNL